jgi:hypothetical protein
MQVFLTAILVLNFSLSGLTAVADEQIKNGVKLSDLADRFTLRFHGPLAIPASGGSKFMIQNGKAYPLDRTLDRIRTPSTDVPYCILFTRQAVQSPKIYGNWDTIKFSQKKLLVAFENLEGFSFEAPDDPFVSSMDCYKSFACAGLEPVCTHQNAADLTVLDLRKRFNWVVTVDPSQSKVDSASLIPTPKQQESIGSKRVESAPHTIDVRMNHKKRRTGSTIK